MRVGLGDLLLDEVGLVRHPAGEEVDPADEERLGVGLDDLDLHLGEVHPVLLGERLQEDLPVGLHPDDLALEVLRLRVRHRPGLARVM